MPDIKIRRASKNDLAAIGQLGASLVAEHHGKRLALRTAHDHCRKCGNAFFNTDPMCTEKSIR